ncbi:hypothetical protein [Nesterenkonia pannonica]|uniref:hypothetical protein n=1 Tax=Nesterenkonia pannonica TaxID=1548602 RepID=UPI0021643663|nr:hypothetical protein [Nesterenkonia pannonica]
MRVVLPVPLLAREFERLPELPERALLCELLEDFLLEEADPVPDFAVERLRCEEDLFAAGFSSSSDEESSAWGSSASCCSGSLDSLSIAPRNPLVQPPQAPQPRILPRRSQGSSASARN